tara:strand:- start:2283 stop:2708 length:426 start_codon:yes stop_codon:yes gene_type:complete
MSVCVIEDMCNVQWLFGTKPFMEMFNCPINLSKINSSLASIKETSKQTNSDDVLCAWRSLTSSLGPFLTARFFLTDEWKDLVPDVQGHGDDWFNVYKNKESRIVARVILSDELPNETSEQKAIREACPVHVRFSIEPLKED